MTTPQPRPLERVTAVMRSLLAALVLLAVAAGPAAAGTATHGPECPDDPRSGLLCSDQTFFRAAPGEANRLVVTVGSDTLIHDDGAPVEAGAGCVQVDANTARCPGFQPDLRTADGDDVIVATGFLDYVRARLGEGNDRSEGPAAVRGEDGDDVLVGHEAGSGGPAGIGIDGLDGGPGDDVLRGLSGADRLVGGPGADVLEGGEGEDALLATDGIGDDLVVPWALTEPRPDRVDGGGGVDEANYAGEDRGLAVDLRGARGAGAASGDTFSGVEGLAVFAGTNDLAGDDGTNRISAGRGRDRIDGRGGDDFLHGGGGADTMEGGDGDDLVQTPGEQAALHGGLGDDRVIGPRSGLADGGPGEDDVTVPARGAIRCGPDNDTVRGVGRSRLGRDCEYAQAGNPSLGATFGLRGIVGTSRSVRIPYAGVAEEGLGERTWWRVVLRAARTRRQLGPPVLVPVYANVAVVRLRLGPSARRRVRAGRALDALLDARVISESDPRGAPQPGLSVRLAIRR